MKSFLKIYNTSSSTQNPYIEFKKNVYDLLMIQVTIQRVDIEDPCCFGGKHFKASSVQQKEFIYHFCVLLHFC